MSAAEPFTTVQIEKLAARVLLVSLSQQGGTAENIAHAISATVNVIVAWAETREPERKPRKRNGAPPVNDDDGAP